MAERRALRVVRAGAPGGVPRGGRRVDVVGESQFQQALTELAGGKQRESQYISTNAELWREPDNAFDPNAVQVRIAGRLVGYLPRREARDVAIRMDAASREAAPCAAEIRGGWQEAGDEGHFGVVVWVPRGLWE